MRVLTRAAGSREASRVAPASLWILAAAPDFVTSNAVLQEWAEVAWRKRTGLLSLRNPTNEPAVGGEGTIKKQHGERSALDFFVRSERKR